jgi:hypothetical protein
MILRSARGRAPARRENRFGPRCVSLGMRQQFSPDGPAVAPARGEGGPR